MQVNGDNVPQDNGQHIFLKVVFAVSFAMLVLVATWNLSANYSLQTNRADNFSQEYENNSKKRVELECSNYELSEMKRCVSKIIEASRNSQRSEYNLTAQENLAEISFWMLVVTFAMFVATVIGVIFVWRTLVETRKIGQAQTRAYLVFENGNFQLHHGVFTAEIFLKNVGNSPSKDLKYEWSMSMGIFGRLGQVELAVGKKESGKAVMSMSIEKEKFGGETIKGGKNIKDYGALNHVWLETKLEWRDVFGEIQTMSFITHGDIEPVEVTDSDGEVVVLLGGELALISTSLN